jgi:multidrug transporter EmrE-like cation transporter
MNVAVAYILISVVTGAVGQVLLKAGMAGMGPLVLTTQELASILWRIATNAYVLVGLSIYALSLVFWLTALSRVDLSYAYPFASLSYVVMLIASWRLFGENLSLPRLGGTLLIIVGVLVISRT